MNTMHLLKQRMATSLLCCGLDPDLRKLPTIIQSLHLSDEDKVLSFLQGVIDVTAAHVCAYKIQKAFFDILPGGHELLRQVIAYVHNADTAIPVLLDCKIGDIDNTMQVYLENVFGCLGADGVLVNPYMGDDVLSPLAGYPDKAVVVLVKTSNHGGSVIQDLVLHDGKPFWVKVLDLVVHRWNTAANLIPVVSSTAGLDMKFVRQLIPDEMPILLAGVGAQGGSYDDLRLLLNSSRSGVFINSSRGLLYPTLRDGEDWRGAVLRSTVTLKQELDKQR